MALLVSLEICGVRNFSPDDKQTIHFNSPVTMFLGRNGCGKTTIIECIRFALTGKLPSGSTKGQGFLNDPQMSNRTSTTGSIQMKFFDADRNMITVSRVISVTTKPDGGLEYNTVNFSVRREDKDDSSNPQDISGRSIDSYCSTSLNVSKSILNNVLFCHQENSAWPLDEPKKLKEKFDEIFDASKYNKAVNNMRDIIKNKKNGLKVIAKELQNTERIKDEAVTEMKKFNVMNASLKEIIEKIRQTKDELEPLRERMEEISVLEISFGTWKEDLIRNDAKREGLIKQQSTIKEDITYIFEGSDDELQNKMSAFQSERATEENTIKELEEKKPELTKKVKESDNNVQEKQFLITRLQHEQNQYRVNLEEAKQLTERLRLSLELEEFSNVNEKLSELGRLREALKYLEQQFKTLVKDKEKQELELQQQIDEIREKSAGTRQMISSKNTSILECQNKLKQIRNKLEELDTSDSQLRIVEDKIEKLQATLTKLKSSFNEAEKLQEIEELNELVERKEQFLDKLDREYRILQQNYVTEQKLDSEKSLIIEKQGEVARIKNKHSHNLQKLFGEDVPEGNFKKLVQDIQFREEGKLDELTKKLNELKEDLVRSQTTMNHQKEDLKKDQKKLAINKEKVSQLCGGKPFNEVLKETHVKKEKLQKEKGQLSSANIMYQAFIAKFEKESPCCPICQTDFASKRSAVSDIITKLRSDIESIPAQLDQKESDLKETEDLYNKLQQLKPINEEIERLTDVKIPKMQEEISDLNEQLEERSMELAAEKVNLDSPQELMEASKNIIPDATLLDEYLSDIDRASAVIAGLEQDIVKVASNPSLRETKAKPDNVKVELSNVKNLYKSVQAETQKQIDIRKLVQEKLCIVQEKTENEDKLADLRTDVDQLKVMSEDEQRQLKNAEEERKIKAEERRKIHENKNPLGILQTLLDSIDRYETNENDSKLDTAVEELAKLKIDKEKLEEAKNRIAESVTSKREALAKKESEFRALDDNVKLRVMEKSESKLASSIEELKKKIDGYNSLDDEKKRKRDDIDKKSQEISYMEGQQVVIEKQVSDLMKKLAKPEYKNANNNYKKQFYEQTVMESGIEDLNQFVVVLEKSVLKFHEERMVHINRTIRELWRSIYRGNDIDYIEIKGMTVGDGNKRKYDYKVVQVKNNVELEMRGRCSAGQKVLACLVIRMALAETLSAHCGIIALDEPTTNLDRENILSLSDALSRIVTDRERESNFQLLIITHDEEFLRSLTQVQSLDSYWRVKRNQDGFSYVEKQFL